MKAISFFLILIILGCNAHLPGSAASLPSTLPCAKEKNPQPVCFSCERAVKILNKLKECKEKAPECERKVRHFVAICSIECQYQLKQKDLTLSSQKKATKILVEEQRKKAITQIITWAIIAGTGGLAVGTIIGFLAGKEVR